jgi:hypothetical protein
LSYEYTTKTPDCLRSEGKPAKKTNYVSPFEAAVKHYLNVENQQKDSTLTLLSLGEFTERFVKVAGECLCSFFTAREEAERRGAIIVLLDGLPASVLFLHAEKIKIFDEDIVYEY